MWTTQYANEQMPCRKMTRVKAGTIAMICAMCGPGHPAVGASAPSHHADVASVGLLHDDREVEIKYRDGQTLVVKDNRDFADGFEHPRIADDRKTVAWAQRVSVVRGTIHADDDAEVLDSVRVFRQGEVDRTFTCGNILSDWRFVPHSSKLEVNCTENACDVRRVFDMETGKLLSTSTSDCPETAAPTPFQPPLTTDLTDKAEKGDAEALNALKRRFAQGDPLARYYLGNIYFNGLGVKQDYAAGAHWYQCPAPSDTIIAACKSVAFDALPGEAVRLLQRMKCAMADAANADAQSVKLSGGGADDYSVCCTEPDHGPCQAVVIGEIAGKWKDLTPRSGLAGSWGCGNLMPLSSVHESFHDVCLPAQGSAVTPIIKGRPHFPAVWQFHNGSYQEVVNPQSMLPP